MEPDRGLEETAYLLSEELRFEASIAQSAANYFIETSQDIDSENLSPVFHYMRGSLTNRLKNCEELYRDAEAVLEATDIGDLESFEKNPEEEVRLAKEKYLSSPTSHEHSGRLGDTMDAHVERCFEALKSDVIGYATGYHHLRSAKSDYEILQENLTELGLNPLDPFEYPLAQADEGEIITEADNLIQPVDVEEIYPKEF